MNHPPGLQEKSRTQSGRLVQTWDFGPPGHILVPWAREPLPKYRSAAPGGKPGQSLQSVFARRVTRCKGVMSRTGDRWNIVAFWRRVKVTPESPATACSAAADRRTVEIEKSQARSLTKAADRPLLLYFPDAGYPGTEPAATRHKGVPMSREGARMWRETLASLCISTREFPIIESIVAFADDEASIAARLGIAPSRVHTRLARLYRKVGVTNRWQLLVKLLLAHIATRRTYVLRMLAEHSRPLPPPPERPNRRTRASCIQAR